MAEYKTFSEVRGRLDQILAEVRKKDLSLEKSLDLYEEAITLGTRCAELVDKPDFSPEELEALALPQDEEQAAEDAEAADEQSASQAQPEEAERTGASSAE